ncbi:MAG TPA: lysylphosphatidylglycerol synthase transmembrane domain-containing protein [Acidobacteriaceae bacterium]|nr:lysylphosphatidylglycerol synthase transmembrane domain-containing protein [Acidobacteriaceae bacterium]
MKKNQWIGYLIAVALLVALALWVRGHSTFEWGVFRDQMQHVNWIRIAIATAMIWLGYGLRAVRWAIFLKPQKKVRSLSLLGSQVIGFTAVALFGRLADLVRPYLVAKRTQLELSSQIAVYTVERMFDAGAMALIFSCALLLAPDRATLPHHEALQRSALMGLAGTVILGAMALWVRLQGNAAALLAERAFGAISPRLGHSAGNKIRAFRDGLNAIQSGRDLVLAVIVSLAMWGMITVAYVETLRAFVLSPELSSMTVARSLVLMAASMAGSVVQLPVIGWFTQIFATSKVMQGLFHVQYEPALGCGAMLLIVSFMSVIPLGLIWARIEHVSLKKVSEESEHLAEEEETGHDGGDQRGLAAGVRPG